MDSCDRYSPTRSSYSWLLILVAALLEVATPRPASSLVLWNAGGNAVNTASGSQRIPIPVSDGAGGAFVFWTDAETEFNIYAQRIEHTGVRLWDLAGVRVTMASSSRYPRAVSDDAGGAIVIYDHVPQSPEEGVYAQRINSAGSRMWGELGIQIVPDVFFDYELAADGAGGIIAVWRDLRNGNADIYAQRLDASGTALWGPDGVAVCDETSGQFSARVASAGSGGAFIVWSDIRPILGDPLAEVSIWIQRVDGTGQSVWPEDGVLVCDAFGDQGECVLTPDGADGVIVSWEDERVEAETTDVYAQRLSPSGSVLWNGGGAPICVAEDSQIRPQIVSDGAGGAIVAWVDARTNDLDIYAQRVDATGAPVWTLDGRPVCVRPNEQQHVRLVRDGSGGAFLAWDDKRTGEFQASTRFDIYAQRLSAAGTPYWAANGQLLSAAANDQVNAELVGAGESAIVVWEDERDISNDKDVYTQKVGEQPTGIGNVPSAAGALRLRANVPNPFSGSTSISFLSSRAGNGTLEVFDVAGRLVAFHELGFAGTTWETFSFAGTDSKGNRLPSGVYLYRVSVGGMSETSKLVIQR